MATLCGFESRPAHHKIDSCQRKLPLLKILIKPNFLSEVRLFSCLGGAGKSWRLCAKARGKLRGKEAALYIMFGFG